MEQTRQIDDMLSNSEEVVKSLNGISERMKGSISELMQLIPKVVSEKNEMKLMSNGTIVFKDIGSAKKYWEGIK